MSNEENQPFEDYSSPVLHYGYAPSKFSWLAALIFMVAAAPCFLISYNFNAAANKLAPTIHNNVTLTGGPIPSQGIRTPADELKFERGRSMDWLAGGIVLLLLGGGLITLNFLKMRKVLSTNMFDEMLKKE